MPNSINIKDVDLDQLIVVKKSTTPGLERTIYYDRRNLQYVKLWNADYYWNPFVYKGDLLNIYKDTTLLKNVIYDDNEDVRGYTSKPGMIMNDLKLSFKHPNKLAFDKNDNQNYKYKSLYKRLLNKMETKEVVYLDFIPGKIAEYKGSYYFYDIEPFVLLEDLTRMHTHRKLLELAPIDYRKSVSQLIRKGN